MTVADVCCRNDVRFRADKSVNLHPFAFLPNGPVFFIDPFGELASAESGAIDGKVNFDFAKRECADRDEFLERLGHFLAFHVAVDFVRLQRPR